MADAISSARVRIFVVPPGDGEPEPVAYVEDCRAEKRFQTEIINEVGKGPGVDTVPNTENGMVSWGRVKKFNDQTLHELTQPQIARWTQFQPFNLLGIDPDTGKPVFLAVGVAPQSVSNMFQAGRACRENYQGVCQYILIGEEVEQAAAA